MAYGNCNTCGAGISWDKQKREQLNTRRPLNYDGTIHDCGGGNGRHSSQQQQQQHQPQQRPNPIQQVVDQKSIDIKAAQEERRQQHRELIKNLQWNTRMLARVAEQNGGGSADEILDSIGFEESREEQRDFEGDVI